MSKSEKADGLVSAVISIVAILFVAVIGYIILSALYPVSPFMATVAIALLIIVTIVLIAVTIRGSS
jgi:zinc transporter ZupT